MSASYQGEGLYDLAVEGDGGHTSVTAAGQLEWESKEGGAKSLRLRGVIGDHQVSASVAVVADTIHIFTRVRIRGRASLEVVAHTVLE